MEYRFLSLKNVMSIHKDQITRYGGRDGVRDRGLLESAIAQPCAQAFGQYLHEHFFLMAAAYLFHLAQNHPFVDGNKRVALVSAVVFMQVNGYRFIGEPDEVEKLVLRVSQGKMSKEQIAEHFQKN